MHMRTRMPAAFAAVLLAAVLLTGCGEAGRDAPTMITKAPRQRPDHHGSLLSREHGRRPVGPRRHVFQNRRPHRAARSGLERYRQRHRRPRPNSLVGTSFKLGGVGPAEFDNPGFVYYCYRQNGITVPRKASAMAAGGREVVRDALQAGDIVVFSNEIGGTADFVGIYIGSGHFVSCNNPSQPTGAQSLSSGYWSERFLTARRYGD